MRINCNAINKTSAEIYAATQTIIDPIEPASRIGATRDIIDAVVEKTQFPVSVVAGFVQLYLANNYDVKVRAGRNGGAFKIIPPPEHIAQTEIEPCESCGQITVKEEGAG